jgi:sialic acid synthase SpsE
MVNIIAEFCQNHLGEVSILGNMIEAAKKNGASHAKIQGLYSDELTKREEFENIDSNLYRPFDIEKNRLEKLDLDFDTEKWFVKTCIENEITPMITIFSHNGAKRAEDAGFKNIKIASYDCASIPLVEKALSFANELVISTGATFWKEISETVKILNDKVTEGQEVALLHARTVYPTPLDDFSLARMLALRAFGYKVGLSDHTKPMETGLVASKIAILLGADYVERHFTVLERDKTKDGPVSITPNELAELSQFSKLSIIEQLEQINFNDLNSSYRCISLEPNEIEIINRRYYRGRVASKIDGVEVFSWENP